MMIRVAVYILLLILWLPGQVQAQVIHDSAAITLREFTPASIQHYQSDPDFQYERVLEPPASLWDRFWDWFWKKVWSILGTKEGERAFNVIVTLLAAAILVFFIVRLAGMGNSGLFGKRNEGAQAGYSVHDENIHAIDFDAAVNEAIENRNYRLAVRLLYLQSLKLLTDRGLINWQLNRTNVSYVQDLKGTSYHQNFNHLTFQFESNWYGDLPIDESEFNLVKGQFFHFIQQLK